MIAAILPPDEFQLQCAVVATQVQDLLSRLHEALNGRDGLEVADASAILTSAIGGALRFAIEADDEVIPGIINTTVNQMLPQMRAQQQVAAVGAQGRA